MLVDAYILLYAVDQESSFHAPAREWLEDALNGPRRVGIPWQSLSAFLRIATHPRAMREPLPPAEAFELVEERLDAPVVWVPTPGRGYREIVARLVRDLELRANLLSDAMLAALCIEHGMQMVSADSDFARFAEVTWINPVARRSVGILPRRIAANAVEFSRRLRRFFMPASVALMLSWRWRRARESQARRSRP